MISRITGKISRLTEETVTIFLNGLHYDLLIPSGLYDKLKDVAEKNAEITLHTINFIEAGDRKNYHYPRLIGFTNPVDKEFFLQFTTVGGLGIKNGLKSLTLSVRDIATAIETRDSGTLKRLPGIGGRMADKIIAELSGKMARFALSKGEQPLTAVGKDKEDMFVEAVEVLMQLQYNRVSAEEMIQKALKINPKIKNTEELISMIFKIEAGTEQAVQ